MSAEPVSRPDSGADDRACGLRLHDTDAIPGQLRPPEKTAIALLAHLVPRDGVVVEVGSLLGLSSWLWAKNVAAGVTVYCCDPWETARGSGFVKLARSSGQKFTLGQFRRNTRDCRNIVPMQGLSPGDFADWQRPVSLYFEDAVHHDPELTRNLDFWTSHLTAEGIVCGHDFLPGFPDVQAAASRLADTMKRDLRLVTSLWYLLPGSILESDDPRTAEIVSRLDELGRANPMAADGTG